MAGIPVATPNPAYFWAEFRRFIHQASRRIPRGPRRAKEQGREAEAAWLAKLGGAETE
tara:strand:- start:6042 stop:6215 length:174 start_codon:yes stop_codon:yes gene_type:complete